MNLAAFFAVGSCVLLGWVAAERGRRRLDQARHAITVELRTFRLGRLVRIPADEVQRLIAGAA